MRRVWYISSAVIRGRYKKKGINNKLLTFLTVIVFTYFYSIFFKRLEPELASV